MTAIIICFQKAVALRNQQEVVENIVNNRASVNSAPGGNSYFFSYRHSDLLNEYNSFIENMRCRHSLFMYPSILAKYRRGINPVSAIYYEVQKVIWLDSHDTYSKWLKSLFNAKEWVSMLLNALDIDIKRIQCITDKFQCFKSSTTFKELNSLKTNLLMYRDTFISILR